MRIRALELSTQRVLGAVRLVDAGTGSLIRGHAQLRADGVRWLRNRADLYVMLTAPGLAEHTTAFATPPATPDLASVELSVAVECPGYLPRRVTLRLPRDPDPTHGDQPASLFRPQDVALLPAPVSAGVPGEARLRISVEDGGGNPRGAVLIQVARQSAPGTVIASGMTEWRGHIAGEALVRVSGLPVTTFLTLEDGEEPGGGPPGGGPPGGGPPGNGNAILNRNIPIRVTALHDPGLNLLETWPDPDEMAANAANLAVTTEELTLASDQEATRRLVL